MKKVQKSGAKKAKKAYSTPKLATHGDVATLTQSRGLPIGPINLGSNLFWW